MLVVDSQQSFRSGVELSDRFEYDLHRLPCSTIISRHLLTVNIFDVFCETPFPLHCITILRDAFFGIQNILSIGQMNEVHKFCKCGKHVCLPSEVDKLKTVSRNSQQK